MPDRAYWSMTTERVNAIEGFDDVDPKARVLSLAVQDRSGHTLRDPWAGSPPAR